MNLAQQPVDEGQEAIQNMRSSTEVTNELAEALRVAGEEFAYRDAVVFRALVEGAPLKLDPIVNLVIEHDCAIIGGFEISARPEAASFALPVRVNNPASGCLSDIAKAIEPGFVIAIELAELFVMSVMVSHSIPFYRKACVFAPRANLNEHCAAQVSCRTRRVIHPFVHWS